VAELAMRLIVGLGNPGPEYVWTPHNLGFLVIDRLAERAGVRVRRPEGKSLVGIGELAGSEIVLAKPQTFMNSSGLAIRDLIERFEASAKDIILAADDAALPWGSIRIRERGSAGGHNGLKSVIAAIDSDEFIRVRLGVGPAPAGADLAEYVLHEMNRAQLECSAEMTDTAAEAVEWILQKGAASAMNRFNRRASGPEGQEGSEPPRLGTN
jgi:PTH1 family peptidyl-tRNA hydrolase